MIRKTNKRTNDPEKSIKGPKEKKIERAKTHKRAKGQIKQKQGQKKSISPKVSLRCPVDHATYT